MCLRLVSSIQTPDIVVANNIIKRGGTNFTTDDTVKLKMHENRY
ncbi:hypothetical protein CES85_4344 [Ochrobactrum quorumnocens]|uniref:Uncharacterized protein n=1 Tax=Ochrobactrum quorumnocens TaxID=271865 RepID=A0A248UA36_9HYPH|nr:hypothetical protein CES85_4344 [[Ochrobactrum] quorumnocens]